MSRASLSSALDRVLAAKKDLAEAEVAHADAIERLRQEMPGGEFLVYAYCHGSGFSNYLVTKGEDGGISYRVLAELTDEEPAPAPAPLAVAP